MSDKPPYYNHDRRALSEAVRNGRNPELVRQLTRRAVEAQMKLLDSQRRSRA